MQLNAAEIGQVPLESVFHRVANSGVKTIDDNEFLGAPGSQHYRLLAWLSMQMNDQTFVDIGTHHGRSALALAHNPSNRVETFDIADFLTPDQKKILWGGLPIHLHLDNLWEWEVREAWRERIMGAALIFLDIDPHHGVMEREFVDWLRANRFQGLLVCDDIWYFQGMRNSLWAHIPAAERVDVTDVGHWSGTGIVSFVPEKLPVVQPRIPARVGPASAGWTMVTAHYDLTREVDSAHLVRFDLSRAAMTMATPVNLVVFCDAASKGALEALRPAHLLESQTRFVVRDFKEWELVREHHPRVVAARAQRPSSDPANTASYYLSRVLHHAMLLETMAENPFGSSHFAWCDIGIETVSWKSGLGLARVWPENRAKFSTCIIDYQSRARASNLASYYGAANQCGMAGLFFTGDRVHMTAVCERVVAKFLEVLAAGFGHSDEQLFTLVYFDAPELFDLYLGDYEESTVNYGWVRERPDKPLQNVLRNLSASWEDPQLLGKLATLWLQSAGCGCFVPSPEDKALVTTYLA